MTALLAISLSACSQSNKKENKEMKKVTVASHSCSMFDVHAQSKLSFPAPTSK